MDLITIKDAADRCKLTCPTLYIAMKRNTLKYVWKRGKKYTTSLWIDEYLKNRKSKQNSLFNGKPVYDIDKGQMSVKMAMEMLGFTKNKVFHLIRTGQLATIKKGYFRVIPKASLDSYCEKNGISIAA